MRLPTLYITILTLAVLVLSGSMFFSIGPADIMHAPWTENDNGTQAPGIDTDGDGRVDRWEHFFTDGTLEKVDLDTDGDGKIDRTDYPQ